MVYEIESRLSEVPGQSYSASDCVNCVVGQVCAGLIEDILEVGVF